MKLLVLLLSSTCFGMGAINSFCKHNPKLCGEVEPEPPIPHPCVTCDPNNPPECGPMPPECNPTPEPEPQPEPADFDWLLISKWGGPEISINKDVKNWPITKQLKSIKISGNYLYSSRDDKTFPNCFGSPKQIQGTFNALVKQNDGSYIAGTFDFEKCGGQDKKILSNLEDGGTMSQSFNLHKGSEICVFMSCNARNSTPNCKERTNILCAIWNP